MIIALLIAATIVVVDNPKDFHYNPIISYCSRDLGCINITTDKGVYDVREIEVNTYPKQSDLNY